jgi:hypothetical protein
MRKIGKKMDLGDSVPIKAGLSAPMVWADFAVKEAIPFPPMVWAGGANPTGVRHPQMALAVFDIMMAHPQVPMALGDIGIPAVQVANLMDWVDSDADKNTPCLNHRNLADFCRIRCLR